MTQAPVAVAIENAADDDIAIVYLGSSDDGHRYGVCETLVFNSIEHHHVALTQMNEILAIVLTMANDEAFFSFVWPHVEDTHPRMIELTA